MAVPRSYLVGARENFLQTLYRERFDKSDRLQHGAVVVFNVQPPAKVERATQRFVCDEITYSRKRRRPCGVEIRQLVPFIVVGVDVSVDQVQMIDRHPTNVASSTTHSFRLG